jgi:hypothetical protein
MLKPAAIITRGFLSLAQPMVERQHGNAKGKIAGAAAGKQTALAKRRVLPIG